MGKTGPVVISLELVSVYKLAGIQALFLKRPNEFMDLNNYSQLDREKDTTIF